ncbi:hypothetical protein K435DRAFT_645355 [Dendrothele bispora CBS 962.96]|uniref:Protein kinase domain-containing protein n=1 Tax=Dendrothele bispora (strain CBS 962.96) TaxID=1314807 RepID=A0A4S8MUE9_DENBC|nr:hypothetical protein K435DRAFT_645355 [Dendrothele bispora CBS 962.96]
MEEHRLYDYEQFWADLQPWLEEQGYMLRSRYQPGWIASWSGRKHEAWAFCEDGQIFPEATVFMDAIRIEDGAQVILKKLVSESGSHEATMALMVSSAHNIDYCNHCVPIYEVLRVPNDRSKMKDVVVELLVMPFLTRWNQPSFKTVGEIVDFFQQTIEGLSFLHSNNIAHNDVKFDNIMMDSTRLYDSPIHPATPEMKRDWSGPSKPRTRTERPVRYLYIDFALADKYPELCPGRYSYYGGDRSVPEFSRNEALCDPFAVDVYRLGNVFRENITQVIRFLCRYRGFEFMNGLINDMTHDDPQKRLKMKEVEERFEHVRKGLGKWKLRSRMISSEESRTSRFRKWFGHWTKQFVHVCKGLPAIPSPS